MMTSELGKMLDEREKTHGSFEDHARITQRLKQVIEEELLLRHERGQPPLNYKQREALDMIAHKEGRIIAGNPDFADHWDDIAGYSVIAKESVPNG